MVTAIVIPIIIFYFYWITKKEMNEQDQKWLSSGQVHNEAVLTGKIIDVVEEKQKFYWHRYIFVQTLKLQTDTKSVNVKKITPITKNPALEHFKIDDVIKVYGMWEGTQFIFHDYETIKEAT